METKQKLISFLNFLHSNLQGSKDINLVESKPKREIKKPKRLEETFEVKKVRRTIKNEKEQSLEFKQEEIEIKEEFKVQKRDLEKKSLCDVCGTLVACKRKKEHEKSHQIERPHQCEKCPKSFKEPSHLQKHIETCHMNIEVFYVCDNCNKGLKCKKALRKHLHQFHVPDKALKCEECGKPFGDKARLKRHYIVHKRARNEFIEVLKNFECKDCGKLFATKSHLNQHSGVHTGLKKFECKICRQGFNFFSSMRNHERNVHRKKEIGKRKEKKIEVAAYTEISSGTNVEISEIEPIERPILEENTTIIYFLNE